MAEGCPYWSNGSCTAPGSAPGLPCSWLSSDHTTCAVFRGADGAGLTQLLHEMSPRAVVHAGATAQAVGPAPPTARPEPSAPTGWYPDPSRRHQYRYWDGERWTENARDAGQTTIDPPSAPVPAPWPSQPGRTDQAANDRGRRRGPIGVAGFIVGLLCVSLGLGLAVFAVAAPVTASVTKPADPGYQWIGIPPCRNKCRRTSVVGQQ